MHSINLGGTFTWLIARKGIFTITCIVAFCICMKVTHYPSISVSVFPNTFVYAFIIITLLNEALKSTFVSYFWFSNHKNMHSVLCTYMYVIIIYYTLACFVFVLKVCEHCV